jgi:hypothetical protein
VLAADSAVCRSTLRVKRGVTREMKLRKMKPDGHRSVNQRSAMVLKSDREISRAAANCAPASD